MRATKTDRLKAAHERLTKAVESIVTGEDWARMLKSFGSEPEPSASPSEEGETEPSAEPSPSEETSEGPDAEAIFPTDDSTTVSADTDADVCLPGNLCLDDVLDFLFPRNPGCSPSVTTPQVTWPIGHVPGKVIVGTGEITCNFDAYPTITVCIEADHPLNPPLSYVILGCTEDTGTRRAWAQATIPCTPGDWMTHMRYRYSDPWRGPVNETMHSSVRRVTPGDCLEQDPI